MESARELLRRLEESEAIDPTTLEQLERTLHGDVRAVPLARWVHCELHGYTPDATPGVLGAILGVDPASELVRAVMRSRVRRGRFQSGGALISWPHFFVEPLIELQSLAKRVGRSGTFDIVVELRPSEGVPSPTELAFDRTVFHDVVRTTRLELADALRRYFA